MTIPYEGKKMCSKRIRVFNLNIELLFLYETVVNDFVGGHEIILS